MFEVSGTGNRGAAGDGLESAVLFVARAICCEVQELDPRERRVGVLSFTPLKESQQL